MLTQSLQTKTDTTLGVCQLVEKGHRKVAFFSS